MTQEAQAFRTGQRIGGYTVRRVEALEHVNGQFVLLEHEATGARHIHIVTPDDNNGFVVVFPTVPQDSTGVAHILEHVVLTGSQKFPVRDPFFAMLPRSLATFMNALTSSDWTAYPFSTRNEKDYYNLLDVYLNACFFPLIREPSFRQEGWRFEFADPEDPSTPLEYKGVVFNEMKGAMSDVRSIMGQAVGEALFPDLTYRFNSGGDPRHIPELSYEALKAFHAEHYHPSNAYFYTYGNLPLERTLAAVEDLALKRFTRQPTSIVIPDQPRFASPIEHRVAYPIAAAEDPKKKSQALLAWVTVNSGDSFDTLAMRVLSSVLLGNAAAPLQRALIESGVGTALADGTGLHDDTRETVFAAGLKGIDPEDADTVQRIVLDTLARLADDGLDPAMVDAVIHRVEIEQREVSNSGYPHALKVFFNLSPAYLYGGDPYNALQFDRDLERLREERERGRFFERLIREQLIDNPHRARIVLLPDPKLAELHESEERTALDAVRAALTGEQAQRIVEQAVALRDEQEAAPNPESLPTLHLEDVPMNFEDVAHTIENRDGALIGAFPQPTNGLVYVDVQTSFDTLPDHLKDLLPVFAFVATRMGAGASDYLEMAQRVQASTGGVGASASLRTAPDDLGTYRQSFTVTGKALTRNTAAFIGILEDFLTALSFDRKHLVNLLGQYRARLETSVVSAGHLYAARLAAAQLRGSLALRERLDGLSQVAVAKRLAALDDEGVTALIHDLEAIRDHLFRRSELRVCVTAEEKHLGDVVERVEAMLAALPAAPAPGEARDVPAAPLHPRARSVATPVAYDAKVYSTVPYVHPDAAALHVLANYLSDKYLHRELREKGGAYGGFASYDRESGVYLFGTYRDPHITRTYAVFDDAVRHAMNEPLDAENLREAILASCNDVDPLLSPDTKGRSRFFNDLAGFTLERRAEYKRRLLHVTAADLQRVAAAYLTGTAALAVVSNEEKIAEANAEMNGIFDVAAV